MMQNVKAVLLATVICLYPVVSGQASDVANSFINKSKLKLETFKKQYPSIASAFTSSAKNDFKSEIELANQFYSSLASDQQEVGFNLLHNQSKKGVSLERYSKKVRQAYQFFGKPDQEKDIVYFGIGYQTQWFFYKIPTLTVTYNTKLTSKDKSRKLNGFVKITLMKDDEDSAARVMSFVIVPGKINTSK